MPTTEIWGKIEQMWRLKERVCGILHYFALCGQTPQREE